MNVPSQENKILSSLFCSVGTDSPASVLVSCIPACHTCCLSTCPALWPVLALVVCVFPGCLASVFPQLFISRSLVVKHDFVQDYLRNSYFRILRAGGERDLLVHNFQARIQYIPAAYCPVSHQLVQPSLHSLQHLYSPPLYATLQLPIKDMKT